MLSAIYPVPASEVRLPFYLSGIGRTSPEFHVKRDKGLTSHQFLYTAKGCGVLEVGNRKYKLEKNSFMYLPPESETALSQGRIVFPINSPFSGEKTRLKFIPCRNYSIKYGKNQ